MERHVQAKGRKIRHGMLTQGSMEWGGVVGVEGSARTISQERASPAGKERAGGPAVQGKAASILTREAAAARRRLQALPGHVGSGREDPPQNALVLREGGRRGRQCQKPRGPPHRTESNSQTWPELLLSCNEREPCKDTQGHRTISSGAR